MLVAICPGSFDPIQNGHLDIIKRASMLADVVYIVIGINPNKESIFSKKEKLSLIKKVVKGMENVKVAFNEGLTVNFAKSVGAKLIIKGYRNDCDLKYELDMARINHDLAPDIETMLLESSNEFKDISSSKIKEMIKDNEDVSKYIPSVILKKVSKKIKKVFN